MSRARGGPGARPRHAGSAERPAAPQANVIAAPSTDRNDPPGPDAGRFSRRPQDWNRVLALLSMTLVAYLPAMRGGFVWDDDDYVTDNSALRTLSGLARIWFVPGAVPQYYPLTFSSFWLEHQLWGLDPAGYHVTNVLLHALNALLVWLVLRRLALPGAWLAAAVFAVHPVHVESVAWITERKNLLSGAFYLGALLAWLRFVGLESPARDARSRQRSYWLAAALFAAALLSKSVTCTLPVVVALLVWWKRGRVSAGELRAIVPFVVLGAGLAAVTVWMERTHVGAQGTAWALSLTERVLIAGRALWFYAASLVWPHRLTFVYPRWSIDAGAWWQTLFPFAAIAVVAALFLLRGRIGRGALTAVLCFAVTLAPALGLVDVYPMRYSFVADHYQYLASMALIAPAAALAARGLDSLGSDRRPVALGLATVVLLTLGVLTWRQAHVYRDQETLWRDTLAKNPGAQMAHVNLGMLLYQRGRVEESVAEFRAALALDPADAEVHGNLGMALAALDRGAEALVHLERAVVLAPDSAGAHNNLANALAAAGRADDAIAHYREAARLRPTYADARNNLANVLAQQGRVDEALVQYREALRIDPDFVSAHYNLGLVLADAGRNEEARVQLRETLRLAPNHAGARSMLAALDARSAGHSPGADEHP